MTSRDKTKPGFADSAVFVLLLAVPIFANLSFGAVSSGSFTFVALLTLLIPVFWLVDTFRGGRLKMELDLTQAVILGLILLGIFQLLPLVSAQVPKGVIDVPVSASISFDPNSTRLAVSRLFIFLVYFSAALAFLNSVKRVKKTVVVLLVFGSLMSFFAILQFLSDPGAIYGIEPAAQARPFGTYVNQHHFASFLVMIFSVGLAQLAGGGTKRDKLVFFAIAVVICGSGVIFTGSRGAFLSLVSVLAFQATAFLILNRKEKRRGRSRGGVLANPYVLVGSMVGLFLLLIIAAVWAGGEEGLMRGAAMQESSADFSTGRIHFWTVALRVFAAHPLAGAGLESFGNSYTLYDTGNGLYRVYFAHNEYLQMLADGGLIGLGLVLLFIYALFRGALRNIWETRDLFARSAAVGALGACFGVMVHSIVDFPLRTNANAFFFLLLAAIAVVKLGSRSGHRSSGLTTTEGSQ